MEQLFIIITCGYLQDTMEMRGMSEIHQKCITSAKMLLLKIKGEEGSKCDCFIIKAQFMHVVKSSK